MRAYDSFNNSMEENAYLGSPSEMKRKRKSKMKCRSLDPNFANSLHTLPLYRNSELRKNFVLPAKVVKGFKKKICGDQEFSGDSRNLLGGLNGMGPAIGEKTKDNTNSINGATLENMSLNLNSNLNLNLKNDLRIKVYDSQDKESLKNGVL